MMNFTRLDTGWYRSDRRDGSTYEVSRSMDHPRKWQVSFRPVNGNYHFELLPNTPLLDTFKDAKAMAEEHESFRHES